MHSYLDPNHEHPNQIHGTLMQCKLTQIISYIRENIMFLSVLFLEKKKKIIT